MFFLSTRVKLAISSYTASADCGCSRCSGLLPNTLANEEAARGGGKDIIHSYKKKKKMIVIIIIIMIMIRRSDNITIF